MALPAQPLGDIQTHAHRARVVDRGNLHGFCRIGFRFRLISQDAKTQQHDVDIPVIENAINERAVAAGVSRVEQGRFHRGNTQGTQVRGRAIDFRRRPPRQHHSTKPGPRQGLHRRERDFTRPTEHEHRLGLTNSIDHSDNLLPKSDVNTPRGSI